MKTKLILAIVGISLLLIACGGGSEGNSLRAAFEKNIMIMEDFSNAMDQAQNADQVVDALNRYTREIEKLGPRMKALKADHPELVEMDKSGRFPEELQDFEEKFASMGMKMMGAMGKVMEYSEEPRVSAAQEKMLETAQKMMP